MMALHLRHNCSLDEKVMVINVAIESVQGVSKEDRFACCCAGGRRTFGGATPHFGAVMDRNSAKVIDFFKLPVNDVVEIGREFAI